MNIFLGIIGALVVIIVLMILFAPKKYDINRSLVIERSLPDVFAYLKSVKNQDHWSPWKKRDPNMKQRFEGTDGTVGFVSKWEGNKQVGTGEQEITGISENKEVITELRFFKPWKSVSEGYLKVEEAGNGTKVVWGFRGVNKPPMNAMMLFFNMDKAVGKDFEEGLSDLKKLLEQT
jgi:hypothetical protein